MTTDPVLSLPNKVLVFLTAMVATLLLQKVVFAPPPTAPSPQRVNGLPAAVRGAYVPSGNDVIPASVALQRPQPVSPSVMAQTQPQSQPANLPGALPPRSASYWKSRFETHIATTGSDIQLGDVLLVVDELLRRGPCNMLVFGCSSAQVLWNDLNGPPGRTICVEDSQRKIMAVQQACPRCKTHLVGYWTKLGRDGRNKGLVGTQRLVVNKVLEISRELGVKAWDVVLVAGPGGYDGNAPGRMQSIATAAEVTDAHSTVYIANCNRPTESFYAGEYFGAMAVESSSPHKLRQFNHGPKLKVMS